MSNAPERIWIDDERSIGGELTVFIDEPSCLDIDVYNDIYNTKYIRADRIEELEAQLINAGSALEMCLDMLEALQKESGRSIEYGEEDAFRRGEWFEAYEFKCLALASATLAKIKGEQK